MTKDLDLTPAYPVSEHSNTGLAQRGTAGTIEYQQLFESMGLGVVFQARDGHIFRANPAAERILGLTLDQMQGRTSVDPRWRAIHEDGSDFPGDTHPAMVALRSGQKVTDVIMGVYNPAADAYRWIKIDAVPCFKPGESEPHQVYATFEDITQQKNARESLEKSYAQLRESEEKYRLLADNITDVIWILDLQSSQYRYVSPSVLQLRGYSADEITKQRMEDSLMPGSLQHLNRVVPERLAAFQRGIALAYTDEIEQPCKDGSTVWTETTSRFVVDQATGRIEVYGVSRDITDRKKAQAALRRSQALLSEAQVIGHIGYMEWNQGSDALMCSSEVYNILGLPPGTSITQGMLAAMMVPADLRKLEAQDMLIIQQRADIDYEYRVQLQDGSLRWLHQRGRMTYAENGAPLRMLAIIQDITERKRAEETLRSQELQARAMLQAIPDLMFRLDRQGVFLGYKADVSDLYDQSGPGLVGKRNRDISPPAFADLIDEKIQATLAAGSLQTFEYDLDLPGQGVRYFEARMAPSGSNEVIAIVRDITERKSTEQILRDSEARARAMLQAVPDMMFRMDSDGTYLDFKADIHDLFDASGQIIGKRAAELFPAEFARQVAHSIETTLATGEVHTLEYQLDIPGMGLRDYESRMAPCGTNEVLSVVRDITDRKRSDEIIRASQARYELALKGANAGTWDWNVQTGETVYNERWAEIVGYTLQELQPVSLKTWMDLCHPDDLARSLELHRKHLAGESEHYEFEMRMRHKNGEWVWVLDRGRVLEWDSDGQPLRMFGTHLDITERKRDEQQLRASEEKYRRLMEAADALIVMFDGAGKLHYANDKAAQARSLMPGEAIGQSLHSLLAAEMADEYLTWIQRVLANDEALVTEFEMPPAWYRASLQPIHDESGRAVRVLVSAFDITELKTAQEKLLELNRTLERQVAQRSAEVQDLYDNSPIGHQSLDANGNILRINETHLNWLGYARDEMLGRPISDFLTPDGISRFQALFPQFITTGAVHDLEFDLLCKDGRTLPVLINAVAIYDEQGNYVMSRSSVFDNTNQKAADEAQRLANQELERALRMKDEFLATMSHELRTPLTGINGLSEALQLGVYGPLNERQNKALSLVQSSGEHLLELINDILDVSKMEAGKLDLQMVTCSLDEICQSSLHLTKGLASKKSQQVQYAIAPADIQLRGDARRLKQMLVNLLSNAIKFTPEYGALGLEVTAPAGENIVMISVWDQGIGIAADDLPKLFRPFVQLDSSLSRQHSGTGLGLALVRRLVDRHGGSISVTSAPGQGSRFTIILPCLSPDDAAEPAAAPVSPAAAAVSADPAVSRLAAGQAAAETLPFTAGFSLATVMIVDDNQLNIDTLSDFLSAQGFHAVGATSGLACLAQVMDTRPDLILMDIQMPQIDGLETIRRLRSLADPRIAALPIIAVTALAMPGDAERCLEAGANAYISKPFRLGEIRDLILQMLRQR